MKAGVFLYSFTKCLCYGASHSTAQNLKLTHWKSRYRLRTLCSYTYFIIRTQGNAKCESGNTGSSFPEHSVALKKNASCDQLDKEDE